MQEEKTQTHLKFRRSSLSFQELNYKEIVYQEAQETIRHLQALMSFLKGNIFINQQIKLQSKRASIKSQSNNHSQLRKILNKQQKIRLERFLEQAGTKSQEMLLSLKKTTQEIQYFLTDNVHDLPNTPDANGRHSSRRSFEALNHKEESTRGQFVAEIFDFINKKFFTIPLRERIQQKQFKKLALYLLQVQTKLSTIPTFIRSIISMKPDIATQDFLNPAYKDVWRHVVIIGIEDKEKKRNEELSVDTKQKLIEKVNRDYMMLKLMMKVTTAAVVTEHATSSIQFIRKIAFGLSFPRFIFDEDEAELRCYRIWRSPIVNKLNSVWNLAERGALKHLKQIIFPKIKTKISLYIPPLSQSSIEEMITSRTQKQKKKLDESMPHDLNIFINDDKPEYIQILLLSCDRIFLSGENQQYENCYCVSCEQIIPQQFETAIIHIHGGGFIALSSETTQSYTRKWANELKIPVFSINYRKPPEYRFPIPVFDCLTGYIFIVQRIFEYMNIRPKNIILAGDSAGGNLCCALMGLLLKMDYPVVPKGILLAYPAVDVRQLYSPSRLYSFSDAILLPTLLLLCLKQYLGDNSLIQYEPLASPLLLSNAYILQERLFSYQNMGNMLYSYKQNDKNFPKGWPRTVIMVGKKDPLYDDSLRLAQRLITSGIRAELMVYRDFSHAFLSLDNIVPACTHALNDSVRKIRELIQQQNL